MEPWGRSLSHCGVPGATTRGASAGEKVPEWKEGAGPCWSLRDAGNGAGRLAGWGAGLGRAENQRGHTGRASANVLKHHGGVAKSGRAGHAPRWCPGALNTLPRELKPPLQRVCAAHSQVPAGKASTHVTRRPQRLSVILVAEQGMTCQRGVPRPEAPLHRGSSSESKALWALSSG